MNDLTTHWRPNPDIRAKALAIIWRDDAILVCAIPDDSGAVKGWRPLGGTIEFGEHSQTTLRRELKEELNATALCGPLLGVLENIYTHQGHDGHEIIFVYEANLIDPGLAVAKDFVVDDEGTRFACAWIPLSLFKAGQQVLFPDGVLGLL